jgi:hypothetical protein
MGSCFVATNANNLKNQKVRINNAVRLEGEARVKAATSRDYISSLIYSKEARNAAVDALTKILLADEGSGSTDPVQIMEFRRSVHVVHSILTHFSKSSKLTNIKLASNFAQLTLYYFCLALLPPVQEYAKSHAFDAAHVDAFIAFLHNDAIPRFMAGTLTVATFSIYCTVFYSSLLPHTLYDI